MTRSLATRRKIWLFRNGRTTTEMEENSVQRTWMRSVRALSWSAGKETAGWHCEMSGKMVTPA